MEPKPWFGPGFDEVIKATIKENWPQNATIICHDEAHRWAKVLLELDPHCDVELNDGMFHVGGDPANNRGHSWLVVNGFIFDPTASQFEGSLNSSYYAAHDSCSGPDLLERLNWWYENQVRPANHFDIPSINNKKIALMRYLELNDESESDCEKIKELEGFKLGIEVLTGHAHSVSVFEYNNERYHVSHMAAKMEADAVQEFNSNHWRIKKVPVSVLENTEFNDLMMSRSLTPWTHTGILREDYVTIIDEMKITVPAGVECRKLRGGSSPWVVGDIEFIADKESFIYSEAKHTGIRVEEDLLNNIYRNGHRTSRQAFEAKLADMDPEDKARIDRGIENGATNLDINEDGSMAFLRGPSSDARRHYFCCQSEEAIHYAETALAKARMPAFIICEPSLVTILDGLGAQCHAYDAERGGLMAVVTKSVLNEVAKFSADFKVVLKDSTSEIRHSEAIGNSQTKEVPPIGFETIKSGLIAASDMVWFHDECEWRAVDETMIGEYVEEYFGVSRPIKNYELHQKVDSAPGTLEANVQNVQKAARESNTSFDM